MKGLRKSLKIEPNLTKLVLSKQSSTEQEHTRQQKSLSGTLPVEFAEDGKLIDNESRVEAHNVAKFLELVNSWPKGGHNHNDISKFAKVPVLSQGWCLGARDSLNAFQGFTPSRDYHIESMSKLEKFLKLFSVVEFSPHAPILFDREWRIIDGYHRWWACCNLPDGRRRQFYYMQLDL